jgi:hypothetical protein
MSKNSSSKQTFTAQLKKTSTVDSAYFDIPFDVEEAFGKKRPKVRCLIDGVLFRTSAFRMSGSNHMVLVNKQIRDQIAKGAGDTVRVVMEADTEPRIVEVPKDVAAALKKQQKPRAFFDSLSYSHQREYVTWVDSAKKAETRARRIEKMLTMLAAGVKGR